MATELVLLALEHALTLRPPRRGLSSTPTAAASTPAPPAAPASPRQGGLSSFSRPGNPYDNAQAEAGWSTLKTELLPQGTAFASLEEARLEVAQYVDTYFNLDRRHSAMGYRSPHQFEHDLESNLP